MKWGKIRDKKPQRRDNKKDWSWKRMKAGERFPQSLRIIVVNNT